MTNNTFVHWVCILYHLYFWWKKYIGNMYIWVHTIYILPLCVPLKRHQTTEVCCALYCSNRTCACSTTNDDFGPGETLLCLEAKTSQECHQQHTLLDKKIILVGNIHTNILFCKDFLDYQPKIWADAEQQEPPTLGGAFLLGFLESGK